MKHRKISKISPSKRAFYKYKPREAFIRVIDHRRSSLFDETLTGKTL